MFISFKNSLIKMGKFRIHFGVRMKSGWGILLLLFYGLFYMAWYLFLGILWGIYGFALLAVLPIKFVKKKVDSGQWEKGKAIKICSISIAAFVLLFLVVNVFSKKEEHDVYAPELETQIQTTLETEITVEYAKDELINKFINEYNAIAQYQMQDISKGNIRTKYHCKANGCWIEMINATEAAAESFTISINAGNSDGAEEKAFAVFADMAKVLDSELTDVQINNSIVALENGEKCTLSDDFTIEYSPSAEVSWGKTDCKITITSKNYN